MKKKLLGILFVLGLLLALPSVVSLAATANGEPCGATDDDNVYWALVDGTLTISGSGAMADYNVSNIMPWSDNVKTIKTVAIEKGVTHVGNYAFYGGINLKSVTMPNSVESIGINAFFMCMKLSDVYYNGTKAQWDGLTKGSGNAYLTNATLHYHCGATADDNVYWALVGDTLTISGSGAMADYDAANSVPWNGSIATIKTVVIENGVTNVGNNAFNGCTKLTSVTIPGSVKIIGMDVFSDCANLTSVTIPDNVETIGARTFYGCINLESITIPKKVTSIGIGAFSGCTSLKSVTIPDSVKTIGASAFYNCKNLESVTIPNGVTDIENYTFYGCTSLTLVTIPDSVTDIKVAAFRSCTSLTSVTIPDSVERMGDSVFWGCSKLQSVTIPKKVTSIGYDAFNGCANLKSVTIPNGVTDIGNNAFYGCTGLTSVTIPKSVTGIGEGIFDGCTKLSDVYYTGTKTEWGNVNGKDSLNNATLHYHCGATADDNVYWAQVGGTLTISGIGNMMNYSNKNEVPWKNIITAKIENGVKNIGDRTFRKCGLESIIIPKSVTEIGNNAFLWCDQLKLVTIPNSVKSIGFYAFSSCRSLTSVTMPKDIETIDHHAFSDCTSLTTIYMPMHYDTASEAYKKLDVGTDGIPGTATKLYYIAGDEEGNITPVTIDSVTYGTDKGNSITLTCGIMGNGYVIKSAKEGTT